MGIFSKLKANLFKNDDEKLVHDEHDLSTLNMDLVEETKFEEKKEEEVNNDQINENIEEKSRFFNPDLATSVLDENKVYSPKEFADVEEIANEIVKGVKVTIDTSSMKNEDIVRSLDFLSGVVFAINGKIIRNSKYSFTFFID